MKRMNISSGVPWESIVGYSRAVRVGDQVHVTGTIAVDERGDLLHADDAYEQTAAVIRKIETALGQAGATLAHVVRTRMFVTDLDRWEEIARAHREFFGEIRPAATMVEVSRLFADALIEMEVDAVVV